MNATWVLHVCIQMHPFWALAQCIQVHSNGLIRESKSQLIYPAASAESPEKEMRTVTKVVGVSNKPPRQHTPLMWYCFKIKSTTDLAKVRIDTNMESSVIFVGGIPSVCVCCARTNIYLFYTRTPQGVLCVSCV